MVSSMTVRCLEVTHVESAADFRSCWAPEKLTVDEYAHERLMLWMLGADPPQKMAVTECALEFSVL